MRNKDGFTVRYQNWYTFVDTEEQAKAFCESENKSNTPYVRKKYPAHYTPWESRDKAGNTLEKKFVCWSPRAYFI